MYRSPLEAIRQSVDEDQYVVFTNANKKVVIVSRSNPRLIYILERRFFPRTWYWVPLTKMSSYEIWREY